MDVERPTCKQANQNVRRKTGDPIGQCDTVDIFHKVKVGRGFIHYVAARLTCNTTNESVVYGTGSAYTVNR
jgi:hypothetical protein